MDILSILLIYASTHIEYAFPWMLIPALISTVSGLSQQSKANDAIAEINKEKFTQYGLAPQLEQSYSQAAQMAKQGFTGKEKGAFRQNIAQDINTGAQHALDLGGGNLARTISKMGTISKLGAENQFATNDALLHRQNIKYKDVLAQAIQTQGNLKSQADISHRVMLEQAYGNASKAGSENILKGVGMGAASLSGSSLGTGTTDTTGGDWMSGMKTSIDATPSTGYEYTAPAESPDFALEPNLYG